MASTYQKKCNESVVVHLDMRLAKPLQLWKAQVLDSMNPVVVSTLQQCWFVRRRLPEAPVFRMDGWVGASWAEESLTDVSVYCHANSYFGIKAFLNIFNFTGEHLGSVNLSFKYKQKARQQTG